MTKAPNFATDEVATATKQQKLILDLMGEIKEFKTVCAEKDKKLAVLVETPAENDSDMETL